MNFTYLHCADLHLGSPLLGLSLKDETIAARFAAASRDAFTELVGRAIEARVAFVLIAGDVYDGEWKDTSIGLFFNREMARLTRAGIPAYLVKGNHDAASVVTRAISLPDTVFEFPTERAHTHRIECLQVAIHGRSFPERAVDENWANSYPAPVEGWFNIGLLHTSCDGRPGHARYAPCTIQDLARRGYDYWALGHVHEYEVLSRDPWIVFPGNLQGRHIRESGAKGAVFVDVADGRISDVRRVLVDRARWLEIGVDLTDVETEAAALALIGDRFGSLLADVQDRLVAVRVRLAGATPLHALLAGDPARIADEVQASLNRGHEDAWLEKLRLDTAAPHVLSSGNNAGSPDVAAMLLECAGDPEVRKRAEEIVTSVMAKFPPKARANDDAGAGGLDLLITDAQALVLGRLLKDGAR